MFQTSLNRFGKIKNYDCLFIKRSRLVGHSKAGPVFEPLKNWNQKTCCFLNESDFCRLCESCCRVASFLTSYIFRKPCNYSFTLSLCFSRSSNLSLVSKYSFFFNLKSGFSSADCYTAFSFFSNRSLRSSIICRCNSASYCYFVCSSSQSSW